MELEGMLNGAKEKFKDATVDYEGKHDNLRKNLIHAAVSAGVYLFFSNFVEGTQHIIEWGSLAYAVTKVWQAYNDYKAGKE